MKIMKIYTKKLILRVIVALDDMRWEFVGVHFYTAEGPHRIAWLVLLPFLPIFFFAAYLDPLRRGVG